MYNTMVGGLQLTTRADMLLRHIISYLQTTYDVTATSGLLVHVKGGIDLTNHQATWELQAMDPATGKYTL